MWVVITLAKSLSAARGTERALREEGVLVRLKPVYKNTPDEENYFEVQVLESEAAEARDILMQKGL